MVGQKLRNILKSKNYVVYRRPFELNIVGLRSESVLPNRFDDEIHVFYKGDGLFDWKHHVFKATTDPGTFWLNQPMQQQGTAILEQGQYLGAYQLGLHRGQYEALVQRKPVTIIRDYNRDAILDFNNGSQLTGQFGINIHRANRQGETPYVDKHSAGCQVFMDAENFKIFMTLCRNHSKLYGNRFTYTLIDFRAVQRQNRKYLIGAVGAATLVGLAGLGYVHREPLKVKLDELYHYFSNLFNKSNHEQKPQKNNPPAITG